MGKRLHILQHSLGVDQFGRGKQYRNHFVTGEGSVDHPACLALVRDGLMTRREGGILTGGDDVFFVTEAGKEFVRANSPKPSAKQLAKDRYGRFLDMSDVMPDLTFRAFLEMDKTGGDHA